MANQRSSSKRSVGGYLDQDIKRALEQAGVEKTQFMEYCIIRGLLIRKKLTKEKVRTLNEQDRIHPTTAANLKQEGLI